MAAQDRSEPPSVYLVRHAEPASVEQGVFSSTGLSARGHAQARRTALALAGIAFGSVLCSPLPRARETAEHLIAGRDLTIEIDANLAEAPLGALEGLDGEAARTRFPEYFRRGSTVMARLAATGRSGPGPQGEEAEAFRARGRAASARLRGWLEAERGALLVVSHGGLLNYALHYLLEIPVSDRVPFGFDHSGVLRVIAYQEADYGPFPMLRFAAPSE